MPKMTEAGFAQSILLGIAFIAIAFGLLYILFPNKPVPSGFNLPVQSTAPSTPPPTWTTFSNPTFSVQFEYPFTWTAPTVQTIQNRQVVAFDNIKLSVGPFYNQGTSRPLTYSEYLWQLFPPNPVSFQVASSSGKLAKINNGQKTIISAPLTKPNILTIEYPTASVGSQLESQINHIISTVKSNN